MIHRPQVHVVVSFLRRTRAFGTCPCGWEGETHRGGDAHALAWTDAVAHFRSAIRKAA